MHNPFLHKKWGCFPKTRAPYLEKWPRYGHVKFEKKNLKISEKIGSADKNCDNSVNFWDIVEFFFAYGHWWPPLKVPLIILHKICFAGLSEAVKQVRVKLPPPPVLWREKQPPCGIGLKKSQRVLSDKNIHNLAKLLCSMTKVYDRYEGEEVGEKRMEKTIGPLTSLPVVRLNSDRVLVPIYFDTVSEPPVSTLTHFHEWFKCYVWSNQRRAYSYLNLFIKPLLRYWRVKHKPGQWPTVTTDKIIWED